MQKKKKKCFNLYFVTWVGSLGIYRESATKSDTCRYQDPKFLMALLLILNQ